MAAVDAGVRRAAALSLSCSLSFLPLTEIAREKVTIKKGGRVVEEWRLDD
jgi:hypothetical protein